MLQKIKDFIGKNYTWIILSLIVIFGLILRLWMLSVPSMWIDEHISALVASKIVENSVPVFDSGLLYSRAIVFHYLSAFFLLIFGGDFGVRFVSVLFGTASIALAFFIGKEFDINKDKENKIKVVGLIAALFTAVLALEIAFSRQSRFYQMFQFLFFLTVFLLYRSDKIKLIDARKSNWLFWIACLSLIVLLDTQIEGLVLVPFFIFVSWRKKDWKLLIVPIIAGVYFGMSLLYVSYSSSLASSYASIYASSLYSKLRPFMYISILGLPIAWKWNKKLTFWLIIPSLLLLVGLFFVKVLALRYIYFILPLVIIGVALLLAFIWKWNKAVFAIVILFALIFPSNIVQDFSPLTILKPEGINIISSSEPVLDYHFNSTTRDLIMNNSVVALWTPGVAWYYKNPRYFVPFSLNGLETGYVVYNSSDYYTGAKEFDLEEPQIKQFVFIDDAFGESKFNSQVRELINNLKSRCLLIENTDSVGAYYCKI